MISIQYNFSSALVEREAYNCITSVNAILYSGGYADNKFNELVGEIDFKIINLSHAEEKGFDIYELFDTYEYTFRHGQIFYNLFNDSFKRPVLNKFPDLEFECTKLCILETIAILPQFRGKKVGARAFKDLVWQFDDCQLFVIQPYPLQFENRRSDEKQEFYQKLELEKFEKIESKAQKTLRKYYQSWGFEKVKRIKDLLFYCPLYRNDAFEKIEMDYY